MISHLRDNYFIIQALKQQFRIKMYILIVYMYIYFLLISGIYLYHNTENLLQLRPAGGICSPVEVCWTAGQQVERSILHQGHDS